METIVSPLCRRLARNGLRLLRFALVLLFPLLILAAATAHAQSPWSATQPAGPVGRISATLNGMATARGNMTTAWFEWGSDAGYGFTTMPTNVGSSSLVARISTGIDGLTPGTAYHYRLVVSNAVGVAYGADSTLSTGMKAATWVDPTGSYRNYPAIPPWLTNIVGIANGHVHCLAITSEGNVVAWGVGVPYFYCFPRLRLCHRS
jgi:hypothetical protein